MIQEIGRKIIHQGNHLNMINIELEGGRNYEVCSRVGEKYAVSSLLRHTENQSYIFIEQYRYPVAKRVLELVAGLTDKEGLSEIDILKEEIREETGYSDIGKIDFLGATSASAGKSTELTQVYDTEISGKRLEQDLGELEDIDVLEVAYGDFDEFLQEKINSSVIISPSVCMAVYMTLRKVGKIHI